MVWAKDEQEEVFHILGDNGGFVRTYDRWLRTRRKRAIINCESILKKKNPTKHEIYEQQICRLAEKTI